MSSLLQDLRHGLRQLRRWPGFTATTILTLSIGIGMSSAIFCLLDGFWLRPMSVPRQQELVRIFSTTQHNAEGSFSYPEYEQIRSGMRALGDIVAVGKRGGSIARPDGTDQSILVGVVSANFFDALGVRTTLGRIFSDRDEELLYQRPCVLLGYTFWKSQLGGDPNVVGRSLTIQWGGRSTILEVCGVSSPTFHGLDRGYEPDLWVAVASWKVLGGTRELQKNDLRWFRLVGRLKHGTAIEQAQAQATNIAVNLADAFPESNTGRSISVVSDLRYRLDNAGMDGVLLFGVAGLIVLLCVVNVAHLIVARGEATGREVALRLALGAPRLALARRLAIECFILTTAGLVLGLGIAFVTARVLPYLLILTPESLGLTATVAVSFQIDWRVFLFSSLITSLIMTLLGLLPMRQIARADIVSALHETTLRGNIRRFGGRWGVSAQVGLSLVLMIATSVLVRSFLNTRNSDIGLSREPVLLVSCAVPPSRSGEVYEEAMSNMKRLPGIRQIAYAIRAPLSLSGGAMSKRLVLPDHPELHDPLEVKYNAVSDNFFQVVGTKIVAGSGFSSQDAFAGPLRVVINQEMANRYWRGQNPIGKVIHFVDPAENAEVIGIAATAPINEIDEPPEPYLYLPFRPPSSEITFLLQTPHDAMLLAHTTRELLVHIDPRLDPTFLTSLQELVRYSAGTYEMTAELVSALGVIGAVLTAIGLYGFVACQVSRRTQEIGIRMALGASRGQTVLFFLKEVSTISVAGMAVGTVVGVLIVRAGSSLLFRVKPWDAPSIILACTLVAAMVSCAVIIPVRRAVSVDPLRTLRAE
jgi:putative ABC transport system permease protein